MCVCVCICMRWRGVWVHLLWGQGPPLMLFLFNVNISTMHPAPWVFLRIEWSIPMVPLWLTASANKEAELKPITFSPLPLFHFSVFPIFLTPQLYSTF